jgi:RNA polymerase sigma factor (sigma-70 family)
LITVIDRKGGVDAPPGADSIDEVRREAFGRLAADELSASYQLATRILGNRGDAEDAVNEAVLRAWGSFDRLRDRGSFRPWLMRIVVNVCRNDLRHRRVLQIEPLGENDRPAPDSFDSGLLRDGVARAMECLGPEQRVVVVLRYWNDLAVDEIARILGGAGRNREMATTHRQPTHEDIAQPNRLGGGAMNRKISQQDLDAAIRSHLESTAAPEPASLGRMLGRLPDRLPDRHPATIRALPAFPGVLGYATIALVLVIATAAIGLPLTLSKPGAAALSQSAGATLVADSSAKPTGLATGSLEPSVASASPSLKATHAASPAGPGRLSLTGSMSTTRWWGQTATLLLDGRILIAGGCTVGPDTCNQTATAELYDPATGKFTPTGSMTTKRSEHTATLLPDGRVLIAGGHYQGTATVAWAELYDPATGKFSRTGTLNNPRYGQTATLLHDGRVLLVGGGTGPAELYDVATGNFTVTGSPTIARSMHAAALLKDGRVLIAGGLDTFLVVIPPPKKSYYTAVATASTELYDPATGKFTPAGSMTTARSQFTATVLSDGRVLLAGGWAGDHARGADSIIPLASAELFDPGTGSFSPTGSMSTPRDWGQTATLLSDGRVLLAGGFSVGIGVLSSTELFDPATGRFVQPGRLAGDRSLYANRHSAHRRPRPHCRRLRFRPCVSRFSRAVPAVGSARLREALDGQHVRRESHADRGGILLTRATARSITRISSCLPL